MAAFVSTFAENADFVNVTGMHWQGRQELEAKHAVAHRTIFRNRNLQIVEQAVRFLSPSIALAHTSTQLKACRKPSRKQYSRDATHTHDLRAGKGGRPLADHSSA
jgi:uncharacterized protein (TIGR02246 family)